MHDRITTVPSGIRRGARLSQEMLALGYRTPGMYPVIEDGPPDQILACVYDVCFTKIFEARIMDIARWVFDKGYLLYTSFSDIQWAYLNRGLECDPVTVTTFTLEPRSGFDLYHGIESPSPLMRKAGRKFGFLISDCKPIRLGNSIDELLIPYSIVRVTILFKGWQ